MIVLSVTPWSFAQQWRHSRNDLRREDGLAMDGNRGCAAAPLPLLGARGACGAGRCERDTTVVGAAEVSRSRGQSPSDRSERDTTVVRPALRLVSRPRRAG